MKKIFYALLISLLFLTSNAKAESIKAGKKITINENTSFEYNFAEHPKVGDVIMKIIVSDENERNIQIFAEYDMPSMRGHHASGKVEFKRNRAGDYVLPIHFAMPGDWEIVLTFEENNEELYQGKVELEI
ncbi:MAG: FixH family protein [Alphaproteobacteria bacterium]|nr:FixH family protein [Alphaproteobacteria bacterium]MBQ9235142.1 FixH family protein [Alphaproteobacteria bacterium]